MSMRRMIALPSVFLLLSAGCRDALPPLAEDGGAVDITVDGGGLGPDSGRRDAPIPPPLDLAVPLCPFAQPLDGEPCDVPAELVCEYGHDPREDCRVRAVCVNRAWQVPVSACPEPPPADCPATRDEAAGQVCETMNSYCDYEGLICHCTNCTDGPAVQCRGDATWHCDAPHPDPECPPAKPNLGVPCAVEGQLCEYECGPGGARQCEGGVWYEAGADPCPISTRRAKKEIRYLDAAQLEKVARKALELKLATYRYKDPALGSGAQLGFILEDAGKGFAGDPSRGRVNLYGYTSMLLATLQAQQRAIESLRREVRSLRRQVRGTRTKGRR